MQIKWRVSSTTKNKLANVSILYKATIPERSHVVDEAVFFRPKLNEALYHFAFVMVITHAKSDAKSFC